MVTTIIDINGLILVNLKYSFQLIFNYNLLQYKHQINNLMLMQLT